MELFSNFDLIDVNPNASSQTAYQVAICAVTASAVTWWWLVVWGLETQAKPDQTLDSPILDENLNILQLLNMP